MATENADEDLEKLDHLYTLQFILKKKLNMNNHKTQHLHFWALFSKK